MKKLALPILMLLLVFVLTRYIFLIGYIPSTSMEPTLKQNSFLVGTRIFSSLEKGDIIIFRHDGKLLVKRIAGVPGDTFTSSLPLNTDYSNQEEQQNSSLQIPEGCYFVLGDNTLHSYDSRYWEDPFVKQEDIVAKLLLPSSNK